MAYTPTEWSCGDTITADKLNKIENALANNESGSLRIMDVTRAADPMTGRLNATWQEIHDALYDGYAVVCYFPSGPSVSGETVSNGITVVENGTYYDVYVIYGGNTYRHYRTTDPDDYPTLVV